MQLSVKTIHRLAALLLATFWAFALYLTLR